MRLQSILYIAAVAQWIEYWPPKPRVVGSIPASRTKLVSINTHRKVLIPAVAVAGFFLQINNTVASVQLQLSIFDRGMG